MVKAKSERFDFDWKATPGEVVDELAPVLAKYGLILKPIETKYLTDTYSFRLRKKQPRGTDYNAVANSRAEGRAERDKSQ